MRKEDPAIVIRDRERVRRHKALANDGRNERQEVQAYERRERVVRGVPSVLSRIKQNLGGVKETVGACRDPRCVCSSLRQRRAGCVSEEEEGVAEREGGEERGGEDFSEGRVASCGKLGYDVRVG